MVQQPIHIKLLLQMLSRDRKTLLNASEMQCDAHIILLMAIFISCEHTIQLFRVLQLPRSGVKAYTDSSWHPCAVRELFY